MHKPIVKNNDNQLSLLVKMDDPYAVIEEVKTIIKLIYSDFDFLLINRIFHDVLKLFKGKYPGYRRCNTYYHDFSHTSDALLAMIRLIHGAVLNGGNLSRDNINLGVICTLMHDTGYIQTDDDKTGTGAKYTLIHIQRSIEFMDKYFCDNGITGMLFKDYDDILSCTGLKTNIHNIQFSSPEIELIGKMLGTADLIGQLADRAYLEKLPFLYREFKEAKIEEYENEFDFFKKTIDFFEITRERLKTDLGDVNRYVSAHFKARFNIDRDLYAEAIQRNLDYLKYLMKYHRKDYKKHLRRGGYIKKLYLARRNPKK